MSWQPDQFWLSCRKLASEDQARVFITDALLTTLMCAPRSVYSWDIVVTRAGARRGSHQALRCMAEAYLAVLPCFPPGCARSSPAVCLRLNSRRLSIIRQAAAPAWQCVSAATWVEAAAALSAHWSIWGHPRCCACCGPAGDKLFFDKRDGSNLDLLTVAETAPEAVPEDKDNINGVQHLSIEATATNQAFSQQAGPLATWCTGVSPCPPPSCCASAALGLSRLAQASFSIKAVSQRPGLRLACTF